MSEHDQMQEHFHMAASELWRDINGVLQNKLAKVKAKLLAKLVEDLAKRFQPHKIFLKPRDVIKSFFYQHDKLWLTI